jgi:heparan-alpha-glucosaminide N-acetyltransferase
MTEAIQKTPRILSIDIMRGLTLFLMLFVNDLQEGAVPKWLTHTEGNVDGMGLADWVFPGFLFMVGMSIPYAIISRQKKGESSLQIFGHIVLRTLSLLLIGVLMMNVGDLNEELSGIDRNLWATLLYVSVFLVWNSYPKNEDRKYPYVGLKALGLIGIVVLAAVFKRGDAAHPGWLEIGWWGILGLIGWGYFAAATACLFLKSNLWAVSLLWFLFIALNILSQMGMTGFLWFLNPVFGVLVDGNVPSIVLAGLTVGLILDRKGLPLKKIALLIAILGTASLSIGFFLRNWFILSKIYGTPSWAMVCNGTSMLIYSLLFLLVDIRGKVKWAGLFQAAGKNSLTTYLAPDVIYFTCWGLGLNIFVYKQDTSQLLAVSGSIVWAAAMIGFSVLLSKINIRLKL